MCADFSSFGNTRIKFASRADSGRLWNFIPGGWEFSALTRKTQFADGRINFPGGGLGFFFAGLALTLMVGVCRKRFDRSVKTFGID